MSKERSAEQTAVSISVSRKVLAKIDARAKKLSLSRSGYLKMLASQDVSKAEAAPAHPAASPASAPQPPLPPTLLPAPINLTAEVYDFLLLAIPAMQEYEAAKQMNADQPPGPPTAEIPDDLAETKLWRFFLLERQEILQLKWIESEKARRDIGLSGAIQIWLRLHRSLWAKAHPVED